MKKNELICAKQIIEKLNTYNIIKTFPNIEEVRKWNSNLNALQIKNILSLNIDPKLIKFNPELLINSDLLNTFDYLKRVEVLVSIKNADGWYHLFDRMLNHDFLNSPKFYQDIEKLKRVQTAQTPLWIIGNKNFIDSPYHDEDFELLVTAKDSSENKLDDVLREVIATIVSNPDSIKSKYHKTDLATIIKYGSPTIQRPNTYPEHSISYLAINKVSLNDIYHLENMEILANNPEIGNYLYQVMTCQETIKKPFYRRIIEEMIEYKDNKYYAFMLCYYAVGYKEAKYAKSLKEYNIDFDIKAKYDFNEILRKIDEKINVVDSKCKEIVIHELTATKPIEQPKSVLKRIFGKK